MTAIAATLSFAASAEHETFEWTTRTLEALGYPLNWQEARTGLIYSSVVDADTIDADALAAVEALARELAGTVATPDHGITTEDAAAARAAAYADGWFPPLAYDDDRNLVLAAAPHDKYAAADEKAIDAILHLEYVVARALGNVVGRHRAMRELAGTSDTTATIPEDRRKTIHKQADRIADRMGLNPDDADPRTIRDRARHLRDLLDGYHRDGVDSVRFALDVGLCDAAYDFPRDHPSKVAHLAARGRA